MILVKERVHKKDSDPNILKIKSGHLLRGRV